MKKKRTVIQFGGDLPDPARDNNIVKLSFTIAGLRPTERTKQMLVEMLAKNFGIGSFHFFGEKFAEDYETSYYETLLHSPEKRRAFEFVRSWYHRAAITREDGRPMTGHGFLTLLAPLFDAFEKRDTKFFKGLAEAVRIVEQREKSSNMRYQGGLNKWLLEYAVKNGRTATHTLRELNEQFVSKFRSITDDKLRERCKRLGVPLKPDVRGHGAVRYDKRLLGKKTNTTPLRRKKE